MTRYTGKVCNVNAGGAAFIDKTTVRSEAGGQAHFDQDIFVHQDDVTDVRLADGVELRFETVADERRGAGAQRATNVMSAARELAVVGAGNYALADPQQLYVPPTAMQAMAAPVAEEVVQKAVDNNPLSDVPRNAQGAVEDANAFLARVFPQFRQLGTGDEFDRSVKALIEQYRGMGMEDQAVQTEKQAGIYSGLRTVLDSADDLLQPASILPLSYLPDLFMAVPVWYYYTNKQQHGAMVQSRQANDPSVHESTKYFCNMVPTQRWADTFQMYNRRVRGLQDYCGDLIPPHVMERMRLLAPHFDHLVIMTPYHDVASADWNDVAWMRSIDPYVVGFTHGVPFMFVVARFSDSGVFPLYHELLGGTIEFLRSNLEALKGFNKADKPFWAGPKFEGFMPSSPKAGNYLMAHTQELIAAFDEGRLFGWLREEDRLPATR